MCIMSELGVISDRLISKVGLDFRRSLFHRVNWKDRLIGIKGSRGTGKTTMLLQYLQSIHRGAQVMYVSMDELYFTTNTLVEFGASFVDQGGEVLVLDEVHRYPRWSLEIKNLYDRYSDLQIIFTGSSIVDITRQEGDLSRRAMIYELHGLSFREFLEFEYDLKFDPLSLKQILSLSFKVEDYFDYSFKPMAYFDSYLKFGYYPFYKENKESFHSRLRQMSRMIIEVDMAGIKGFDIRQSKKLLQLLHIISQQVPFKPNISKLGEKTNIHRNSMNNYLYYLHEARLVSLLYPQEFSVAALQKPEKIFLNNTNMMYALTEAGVNLGAVRETFFNNQVSVIHKVSQSKKSDFIVDGKYTFEVGGEGKSKKQIQDVPDSFRVKDGITWPSEKTIPLWMFGFLY